LFGIHLVINGDAIDTETQMVLGPEATALVKPEVDMTADPNSTEVSRPRTAAANTSSEGFVPLPDPRKEATIIHPDFIEKTQTLVGAASKTTSLSLPPA
jgi:hypothetical protein